MQLQQQQQQQQIILGNPLATNRKRWIKFPLARSGQDGGEIGWLLEEGILSLTV